jgi:hypothetical protein
MADPANNIATWLQVAVAPLSVVGLALFTWVVQGKLAERVEKSLMDRANALDQKLDLITGHLKENVQFVGSEVKLVGSDLKLITSEIRSLKGEITATIDASKAQLRNDMKVDFDDLRKDVRDILVANAGNYSSIQAAIQNFEKLIALHVRAEVASQIARGAGQSGD